jgi:anti-anti-sigma factor
MGEASFDVDVDEAGVTTLHLRGDLDASTSIAIWRQLDDFQPTRTVTMELSDVGFVDSSGIGCLFKLYRRVADADGILVATGASPALRHLMEMAGLNRVIAILP